MTIQEVIEARHSVRAYKDQPLSGEIVKVLEDEIVKLNNEGQLHIQLICNEPKAFQGTLAKYGKFRNANNYLVMAGRKSASKREESKTCFDSTEREQARTKFKADDLGERIGYYGDGLGYRQVSL